MSKMNIETLKDLQLFLNELTEEQLTSNELLVKSDYSSGVIQTIEQADTNYYWLGDDDPSELLTEREMKEYAEEEGWEEDEYPEIQIKKGDFLFSF